MNNNFGGDCSLFFDACVRITVILATAMDTATVGGRSPPAVAVLFFPGVIFLGFFSFSSWRRRRRRRIGGRGWTTGFWWKWRFGSGFDVVQNGGHMMRDGLDVVADETRVDFR